VNAHLASEESPSSDAQMTKEKVIELVEKWRGLLLLGGHHIDVYFTKDACQDDERCSAEIRVNTPYMSGHALAIHPRFFEISDDDERERKIVHELTHIITDASRVVLKRILVDERFVTWRDAKEADERTTDHFANVVYALAESRSK
jgi:hypothetical protein